ncbi:trehalose/maltose hydrolase-like predicted phosphorylase [Actinoplanes campanulatus]|uniref:Trehalose/maltose hydrolase-like predicted phosphorylase n=1 Tax=Actinoplanes campanulatus TaxID=113559 RepID=A0A7W5FKA2_9ACTN|nr:glycoside hydrolase family 65 protein [Actinoplanes campanulatus]MBB3101486.1 trehalose/maltose hydrolase-like predicted phosphorylase [Actinoplanes campanulatus]GGN50622.1 hypothetical protein GCM10010109_89970 [Actinoplanes campanulatus]GID42080.1 hypothetical protein Aca09nite_85860 [Actinoplanes campanulatus]
MSRHPAYPVEPWQIRETHLDVDLLARSESIFALGNGHIGLRGNLEEGEPHALPGSYLNSFYELRPLPYAEAGYGYPESGQTIVNVTNGKVIRLLVDDEPFDVRDGRLRHHERVLDLRAGVLRREVEWESAYLDTFWDGADVEIDGDAEVQQAVRFGMFHVLQAGARAERRPIAAKGLTGPGYDGHVFWDTERYVLPVLTYVQPNAAAGALRWRHATLDLARERAGTLGWAGAAFPWRTIRGHECSGYWPAGTAAVHIGADIADAVTRYTAATGDTAFDRDVGAELLVETARPWVSYGHYDRHGVFHLHGVTGPDEYTAVADDNVYTNLMARRNLIAAADAVARHPERATALAATADEVAASAVAAKAMCVPYDEELGVHPQVRGFTLMREWDFGATGPGDYPLMLHFPYLDLYRSQVIKQTDVVLAMHWCGDAFTAADKARNFAYYERRTVRDSSLSACTQAVLAAEVGHLELAHDYIGEAALTDLYDLHRNTRDGLHIASLAGAWISLVAGLGGMRDHDGVLSFAPRLPSRIERLRFSLLWHGLRLHVTVRPTEAEYTLRTGDGGAKVELWHHGERLVLTTAAQVIRPVPPITPLTGAPEQPPGRRPVHRPGRLG